MRSILLLLATVAAKKHKVLYKLDEALFGDAPAFPPFAHNDSTAYVFHKEVTSDNAKRLQHFAHNVKKGHALQEISGALRRGDITWNALGVAFRRGFRHSKATRLVKELLSWRSNAHDRNSAGASDAVLKLDGDERYDHPRNADAYQIDAAGYALIDDWGLGEDRLRRLSVLANEALALQHKSGPETQPIHVSLDGSQKMWMRPENHPDLKAWLASPRLKAAVDAYLPNAYKQAKVVALRIGDGVKPLPEVRTLSTPAPDYWSGYWHHDRCGRRLKAFLFLHDILPDGRPTMVANASHRTHYFTYDWLKGSRFADKYIRENYDVVPMTGKRGGGFIFDTNAIHKGTRKRGNQPMIQQWRRRAATI